MKKIIIIVSVLASISILFSGCSTVNAATDAGKHVGTSVVTGSTGIVSGVAKDSGSLVNSLARSLNSITTGVANGVSGALETGSNIVEDTTQSALGTNEPAK